MGNLFGKRVKHEWIKTSQGKKIFSYTYVELLKDDDSLEKQMEKIKAGVLDEKMKISHKDDLKYNINDFRYEWVGQYPIYDVKSNPRDNPLFKINHLHFGAKGTGNPMDYDCNYYILGLSKPVEEAWKVIMEGKFHEIIVSIHDMEWFDNSRQE